MPAALLENEELDEHGFNRLSFGLAERPDETACLGEVGRDWLFCPVVQAQQPRIGRVLAPRQMSRGCVVVADMVFVIVHAENHQTIRRSVQGRGQRIAGTTFDH